MLSGYIALDKRAITARVVVAIEDLLSGSFGEAPTVEAAVTSDGYMQYLETVMRQPVWGHTIEAHEYRWPINWKEAIKERFLPWWLRRIWPIRYHRVRWEMREVFPHVVQEKPGVFVVIPDFGGVPTGYRVKTPYVCKDRG